MEKGEQRIRDAARMEPIIGEDLACRNCGYNLKGLVASGQCPECGRPIRRRRKRNLADCNMTAAPLGWLHVYSLGATLTFIAWPAMVGSAIVRCMTGSRAVALVAFAAGCAWWLGVCITTRPRPRMPDMDLSPAREWFWQRTLARLLTAAVAIPLGVLLATSDDATAIAGMPVAHAWALADVGLFASALGYGAFAFYMFELAHWAGDYQASTKWRASAAAILIATVCVIGGRNANITQGITSDPAAIPGGVMFVVLFLAFVGAPIVFALWSLLQQRDSAVWAISNHQTAQDKVERDREKLERERAESAAAGPADIVPHIDMPNVADSKKLRYNPRTMVPGPAPKRIKFTDPELGGDPDPYALDPEGTPAPVPGQGAPRTRKSPGLLYNPKTMTPGPAPKRVDFSKLEGDDPDRPAFDLAPAPENPGGG
jgi:hypothetical protein